MGQSWWKLSRRPGCPTNDHEERRDNRKRNKNYEPSVQIAEFAKIQTSFVSWLRRWFLKYYIAETRKVHTSRNYEFLTNLPLRETPPDPMFVAPLPALPREGECASNTQQTGSQTLNKRQHEEPCEDVIDPQEPLQRRLRTKAPVIS